MLLEYAETDWLGSKPVFYNERTGKISHNIHEVIDFQNVSFHPEGLRNYLRFGYSVFGQTPIQDVKFLRYSSSVKKEENGKIKVDSYRDPVEDVIHHVTTGSEVIQLFKERMTEWEQKTKNTIVIPLSGGYDSKFLLTNINDKSRIRAYSYGYSKRQYDSFEVVRAKKTAEKLGIEWKHIALGKFLDYLKEWDDIYGPAVHAHGMYQIEFYKKILEDFKGDKPILLSGIIGDAWAGNVRIGELRCAEDVDLLGYAHNLCIDEDVCLLPDERELQKQFWCDNREKLKEENWRIVFAMRMKIMLLRYLLETPEVYGISSWSPFLDFDVATAMLNISWKEKENRLWQKKYFEDQEVEYGWLKKECDYNMIINENALRQVKPEPLNSKLLGKIIRSDYVEWINKELERKPCPSFSAKPKTIPNIANKVIKKWNANKIKALTGYEVLYPLQKVMEKSY